MKWSIHMIASLVDGRMVFGFMAAQRLKVHGFFVNDAVQPPPADSEVVSLRAGGEEQIVGCRSCALFVLTGPIMQRYMAPIILETGQDLSVTLESQTPRACVLSAMVSKAHGKEHYDA